MDDPITVEILPGGWALLRLDNGRVLVVTSTILEENEVYNFAEDVRSLSNRTLPNDEARVT